MTTVYINEYGVRPWESAHPTNDARFTTTTLLSHNFESAWRSWCSVVEQLPEDWSIKREWHSAQPAEFNSKTEEYLFKKNTIKTIQDQDFFKKNENSNIYSTIKNLPNTPKKIDNQFFEGSHNVILIIQKIEIAIENLWSEMTIFEKHITAEKISSFFESQTDILICRFYEAETHAAAQFIYHTNIENQKIIEASKMRFKKIGIEDVHFHINTK